VRPFNSDPQLSQIEDLFSIERKTVSDLVNCCMGENRDRFDRELYRCAATPSNGC
jgi:hypothetical protein